MYSTVVTYILVLSTYKSSAIAITMKTPHSVDELIQQIQISFNEMSPQFKKGARYLLDHPNHVSTLSARKLAALAGVQPATLIRLAQSLGFAGWDNLKVVFMRELQVRPDSYAARAQSLVERPLAGHRIWHEAIAQQAQNLKKLEPTNQKYIKTAINLLDRAKRIFITGFRSSYPAAYSLYYLCSLFNPEVYLLHNTGGSISLDLHHLDDNDTIVLIGYAPYSRELANIAKAAKEQNCGLLAIADSKVAPFALEADCILTFSTTGNSFFPSTVAIQSLVEMLALQLLVHKGEKAIAELSKSESRLHSNADYL